MRWPVDFAMWHSLRDQLPAASVAIDLSEEGLAFRSGITYSPDTVICVGLEGPDRTGATRQIAGIVRHSSMGITGVEFTDVPPDEKQRILEVIYLAIALRRR